MSAFPVPFYTPKEYLEKEVKAEFKSEYWDGQIYAMAGGSPRHSELGALFTAAAVLRLKGKGCGVFTSHLRIKHLRIKQRRLRKPLHISRRIHCLRPAGVW